MLVLVEIKLKEETEMGKTTSQELLLDLNQRVGQLEFMKEVVAKYIGTLERENLALTAMLDEGQSLAMDGGDPETMYRLQRDLANWAGRANTLMYEQAKGYVDEVTQ